MTLAITALSALMETEVKQAIGRTMNTIEDGSAPIAAIDTGIASFMSEGIAYMKLDSTVARLADNDPTLTDTVIEIIDGYIAETLIAIKVASLWDSRARSELDNVAISIMSPQSREYMETGYKMLREAGDDPMKSFLANVTLLNLFMGRLIAGTFLRQLLAEENSTTSIKLWGKAVVAGGIAIYIGGKEFTLLPDMSITPSDELVGFLPDEVDVPEIDMEALGDLPVIYPEDLARAAGLDVIDPDKGDGGSVLTEDQKNALRG